MNEQDTREKLLDYIWREITTTLTNNGRLHDPNFWYANIVSWLDHQAKITADEIVKCGECMHYNGSQCERHQCENCYELYDVWPDDYCSYGVRI